MSLDTHFLIFFSNRMHWWFWWWSLHSTNRCLIQLFSFTLPEAWMLFDSRFINQQRLGFNLRLLQWTHHFAFNGSSLAFLFCQGQLFICLCILVLSSPDILFLFFWPSAPIYYSSWSCIFIVVYLSGNYFLGGLWYMWTFAVNLQFFLLQSQSH